MSKKYVKVEIVRDKTVEKMRLSTEPTHSLPGYVGSVVKPRVI